MTDHKSESRSIDAPATGKAGAALDRDTKSPQTDPASKPVTPGPLFIGTSVVPYVYINKPPTGPDAGKFLQAYEPQSPPFSSAGSPAGSEK
jgi:hypothetical protein